MMTSRRGVFYGWWIVLTSAFAMFVGPTPIVVFSFGVFLKPLAHEFHAGRAAISFAFAIHNIVAAAGSPITGWLTDRFGARKVILPSTAVLGIVLLANNFSSSRIWQLYAFFAMVGLFEAGAGPVPYGKVISRWFDKNRGLALGGMLAGLGFGALGVPSLAQYLIVKGGWRLAYAAVGATTLLSVPVLAWFLKERPETMNLLPDGASLPLFSSPIDVADQGISWRQALHTPTFWLLLASISLVSSAAHACFTHLPAILGDRGITARAAALSGSLLGAGLLLGRSCSGFLMDRFFAPYVAAVIFAGAASGIGWLSVGGSHELTLAAPFFAGLALGSEVDVIAYLTSRYFGLFAFGKIYGWLLAAFVLAGAFGAFIMGAAFDVQHSYTPPLALFCLSAALGAALITRLGPYRYAPRAMREAAVQPSFEPSV